VITCQASPRSGEAPLRVDFATFANGGTGTYEFEWTFGDGGSSNNPNPSHTFTSAGVFDSTVRVVSGDQIAACSRPITVTAPPTPFPPTPTPPLTFKVRVTLAGSGTGVVTGPGINCPGDCDEAYPPATTVTLTATATTTPSTVFKGWTGDCSGTGPCVLTVTADKNVTAHFELNRTLTVIGGTSSDVPGTVTSAPAGITCAWVPGQACTDIAVFMNGTTVTLTAVLGPGGTRAQWGGACAAATGLVCTVLMDADKTATIDTFRLITREQEQQKAAPALSWSSQLDVPDAEGQVVMNGRLAAPARPGIAALAMETRPGTNRVEAALVRGGGRPGTWRFDFSGQAAFKPGSLRVVAGAVALITSDAVVFRLQGTAGERVVFTFEVVP
jgi:uncharacterized repeat protein (TIGR02543 family)